MAYRPHYMPLRKPGRSRWIPSLFKQTSRTAILIIGLLIFILTVPFFLGYSYYVSIIDETPMQGSNDGPRYTIVIPSQPRRLRTLKMVVAHYGRCPSVKEIVIVWGKDSIPEEAQLVSRVPVRVRSEEIDGLNNRFKPDPRITTDAILSFDDDILMWCSDIEAGFKEWQLTPYSLVGFFPRLIVVPDVDDPSRRERKKKAAKVEYLGERDAYRRGEYNALLTGAMFYNAALMKDYWQPEGFSAMGRRIVEKLSNCEDILMNYIAAAHINKRRKEEERKLGAYQTPVKQAVKQQVVKYIRPHRRLDVSQLTSVGISRNTAAHLAKREHCVAEFTILVESNDLEGVTPELSREKFKWSRKVSRPICWIPGLGCIHL